MADPGSLAQPWIGRGYIVWLGIRPQRTQKNTERCVKGRFFSGFGFRCQILPGLSEIFSAEHVPVNELDGYPPDFESKLYGLHLFLVFFVGLI